MVEQDRGQNRDVAVPTLGGDQQPPAATIVQDQLSEFQRNRQDNRPPQDRPLQLNSEPTTLNFTDIYNQNRLPENQNRPDQAATLAGPPRERLDIPDMSQGLNASRWLAENVEHGLRAISRYSSRAGYVSPGLEILDTSNHLRNQRFPEASNTGGRAIASIAAGGMAVSVCAFLGIPDLGQAYCGLAGGYVGGVIYDGMGALLANSRSSVLAPPLPPRVDSNRLGGGR